MLRPVRNAPNQQESNKQKFGRGSNQIHGLVPDLLQGDGSVAVGRHLTLLFPSFSAALLAEEEEEEGFERL